MFHKVTVPLCHRIVNEVSMAALPEIARTLLAPAFSIAL